MNKSVLFNSVFFLILSLILYQTLLSNAQAIKEECVDKDYRPKPECKLALDKKKMYGYVDFTDSCLHYDYSYCEGDDLTKFGYFPELKACWEACKIEKIRPPAYCMEEPLAYKCNHTEKTTGWFFNKGVKKCMKYEHGGCAGGGLKRSTNHFWFPEECQFVCMAEAIDNASPAKVLELIEAN